MSASRPAVATRAGLSAAIALAAGMAGGLATDAAGSGPAAGSAAIVARCAPASPEHRTCLVASLVGGRPAPQPGLRAAAQSSGPNGLWPQDLQSAYGLSGAVQSVGVGQTVAVIEAYDEPNLEADLGAFRSQFAMPSCTSANGCFRKVDENGRSTGDVAPAGSSGWGVEAALDVEAVSATCPRCHLLVVEALSTGDGDFIQAIAEAARLGATQISLSFSGCEGASDQLTSFDTVLRDAGVPIVAASGDAGYLSNDNPNTAAEGCAVDSPGYPASSPFVTAAGGTSLQVARGTSRGWTETAWAYHSSTGGSPWGGGSGCSTDEPKPSWQHDGACSRRMVADVAADADPLTGMAIYDTYDDSGWDVVGGTSLATPLIAGIDALEGATGSGAQAWYAATPRPNDITSGSNAPNPTRDCPGAQSYFCVAAAGYDGPTGVGTPAGVATPAHAVSWNGATSLGDALGAGGPQAVSPAPGTIDTFWRSGANTLELAAYSGGSWHPAVDLGGAGNGALASDPHPVATGNGTVDVFWRGSDGNLWHVYELNGSSSWAAPASLGAGPLGGAEPEPASSGHGDVAVFWEGTDRNLWEASYRPGAGWVVPVGLGAGPLNGTPHPAAYTTDSYDVFWRGTDSAIWHAYGGAGGFSGAGSIGMGPIGGDPIPIATAPFAISLYWPGTDQGLWRAWYAGAWKGPQGYGGMLDGPPVPVAPSPGVVDVFWRGPGSASGDAWHLLQGSPAELYEPNLIGPAASPPAGSGLGAFSWGGGHEELFWQGTDGALWHDWTG